MKVTLDLDQLLSEGKITQIEYEKFSEFAAKSTGSLAFNILIGFGVVAVSGAALALVPAQTTAIVIGLCLLISGLVLVRGGSEQWKVLANICILVGALMTGVGMVGEAEGSLASIVAVTAIFIAASIIAGSTLLAVLATFMLSASVGSRSGYFQPEYFLQEPTFTIIFFGVLALGLYQLSKRISAEYERIAIASARAGVVLVNFGFWAGSLWGGLPDTNEGMIADLVFAALWAVALIATALWSWRSNRRWVLNTVAAFGGMHFYTQWFERLGASPETVLVAGLLALGFAVGLRSINIRMTAST
jgi:hypothetical protein